MTVHFSSSHSYIFDKPAGRLSAIMTAAVLFTLPLLFSGCSGRETEEKISTAPSINIKYSGIFDGETPSGDLNLKVYLDIANSGYQLFEAGTSSFSIDVSGYSYKPSSGDIEDIKLTNGDNASRILSFQVPPEAATPRVGYSLKYAGGSNYHVSIERSADTGVGPRSAPAGTVTSQPAIEPEIHIEYSTDLFYVAPPGLRFLKVDPPGEMYLMVEMFITNKGYASFQTTPGLFSLHMSNAKYSFDTPAEPQLIDWRDLDVQNSGYFTGTLAFKVPRDISQSLYPWDYDFKYSGVRDYNVTWTRMITSRSDYYPLESHLEDVNLTNGENLTGQLAYLIESSKMYDGARYEMVYDVYAKFVSMDYRNVQFADQPDLDVDVNGNAIGYPAVKVTYSTSFRKDEQKGNLYMIVDLIIENRGYPVFNTSPSRFKMEITHY